VTERPAHDTASEKDKVRPYHARDLASGQETAEAVAAVLKHAAEREEAAREKIRPKQQPRWMLPLGLNLGVLAVYLLIAPPGWVVVSPIAPPPDAERVEDLRTAMYFATVKIDGFRAANDRLPATLVEAGVSGNGIDYNPRGNTYVLTATLGEEVVLFDSSQQSAAEWAGDVSSRIGG
jgi:hypothetical protein